jgi:hypothetical protein
MLLDVAREFSYNDPDRPVWGCADPLAGQRPNPDQDRMANADLARSIHASQRLAGTSEIANTRHFTPEGYEQVVHRDAVGRVRVDWDRVSDLRDEQGRFAKPPPYEG